MTEPRIIVIKTYVGPDGVKSELKVVCTKKVEVKEGGRGKESRDSNMWQKSEWKKCFSLRDRCSGGGRKLECE